MGLRQPVPRAKICIRCGQDCSNVPRRKNPAGQYCCRQCLENPRRAAAIRQQRAAQVPGAPAAPQPADFGLSLDAPLPERPPMRECPGCGRLISGDAATCVFCGYSAASGAPVRADGAKCRHCGYDLTGLRSARCPECGKLHVPRRFVGHGEEVSREVIRREYLKPALMLVICLPLAFVATWLFDGRDQALGSLLGMAVQIPVSVLVYLGCCILWIGFDAPLHLTVLRITGILSAVALTAALTGQIQIFLLAFVINLTVYVGLLSEMLDMDLSDAAIVAILSYFGGAGVWMWVWWAFLR